ncbi:MAG: DNA-directed RNA polymerase subunit beta' [Clostridia bacterium]|nr:DNA-directed RNA polymerase subunit beta' [Clostridia bacterium]
MVDFKNYDSIQIGLASPEKIKEWSHGEVKKPETINYRTLKPEKDGLFCERIFGPTKDGECHCGKYKKNRYKGIICDKCGVEVTSSKVRRTRMGHIELAAPVSHIWFFKGVPSRLGLILDMSAKDLEKVLYFVSYVVLDPKQTMLEKKKILSEREYNEQLERYGDKGFVVGMGAEAIQTLLKEIDLEALSKELKEEIADLTEQEEKKGGVTISQRKTKLVKRLEVVEAFLVSGNKPEWMILTVIPVIPPDLRPMVQLDGGRFATSDLNDLYRRVINRNNRLKKLQEQSTPDIIVRNEKRMLQEAVDALMDNGRRGRAVLGPGSRPLKSLSDMLRGKQGRFRQNLLGKRVDYSGRSVIVVGPELKIYQCGLPKEMALELFKPFVMKKLVDQGIALNVKMAKKKVERGQSEVWDVLDEIIKEHPVFLNRAPTLHRLGIQAFEPVLVEGKAIKLHPLVCTPFNADFDGDQMAIHVPLSAEAQAEARFLMLSANNLLAPKDGKPINVPTQDMVLGSYYLTKTLTGKEYTDEDYKDAPVFENENEARMAYDSGYIKLQQPIRVQREGTFNGEPYKTIINTTMGKLIFNEGIPQDLGFIDRTKKENALIPEIDKLVKKGTLGDIIDRCINKHGLTETAAVLDTIKAKGYKYSTRGAITVGVEDIIIPPEKQELIDKTDAEVEKIWKKYRRGLCTNEERYENVTKAWQKTTDDLTDILKNKMDKNNPIFMMSDSGARGNINQIKQLAGMRGLMLDTSGKPIEIPIKSNFREGLDVLEFFISSHGTRKTLSDTALRTADSGYLTRRLVDVSQEVIIREKDCGTDEGIPIKAIKNPSNPNEDMVPLHARIEGRYASEDVIDPETGAVLVKKNEMIDEDMAKAIEKKGIEEIWIRSVIKCECHHGVCSKCYGWNLSTHKEIDLGEAVGIIAAQSIGEPGTQLTMRTFHTGGVAGAADITGGLPRVEELFEARKPKGVATISEIDGVVEVTEKGTKTEVTVKNTETGEERSVVFPEGNEIAVQTGDEIKKGDYIVKGSKNPHDIMSIFGREDEQKGIDAVQDYIIEEVQKVYNLQGIKINDRHIEIIVRQMLRKVRIGNPHDANFLPGAVVDLYDFNNTNKHLREEGKEEATGTRILLGITKASLATESFLSAASFQETTRVLTDASIKGKRDPLMGLKENVLIGKLIPAGTGMSRYRDIEIKVEDLSPAEIEELQKEEKKRRQIEEEKNGYAETAAEDEDINEADEPVIDDEGELVYDEASQLDRSLDKFDEMIDELAEESAKKDKD